MDIYSIIKESEIMALVEKINTAGYNHLKKSDSTIRQISCVSIIYGS